jgi:hypothetical protein
MLFSWQSEIKAIVKKRRDFEYAIARPGKTKVDFFRYLEYEFTLDNLRRKRVERLGSYLKKFITLPVNLSHQIRLNFYFIMYLIVLNHS